MVVETASNNFKWLIHVFMTIFTHISCVSYFDFGVSVTRALIITSPRIMSQH